MDKRKALKDWTTNERVSCQENRKKKEDVCVRERERERRRRKEDWAFYWHEAPRAFKISFRRSFTISLSLSLSLSLSHTHTHSLSFLLFLSISLTHMSAKLNANSWQLLHNQAPLSLPHKHTWRVRASGKGSSHSLHSCLCVGAIVAL